MSFVMANGRDVAQQWDTDQPFEADQAFRMLLKIDSRVADYRNWTSWRHPMKKEAGKAGVVELGFNAAGKAYRLLSKFNGKKCIVLLCVCYHKGSRWTPNDAVEIATERAKTVTAGRAKLNVIPIQRNL